MIFNTRLCSTNFHELPTLVRFFRDNADVAGMCSFQLHADCLDPERLDHCALMVMTPDGPMSMCLHNANRDLNITKAFKVGTTGEEKTFNPVREPKREYWTKKLAAFQAKKPVECEPKDLATTFSTE